MNSQGALSQIGTPHSTAKTLPAPAATPVFVPTRAATHAVPSPALPGQSQPIAQPGRAQTTTIDLTEPTEVLPQTAKAAAPQVQQTATAPTRLVGAPSETVAIPGLTKRLDELTFLGGCSSRIAWSVDGTIAAISPDSRSIGLYHFWANLATRQWQLSDRIPLAIPNRIPKKSAHPPQNYPQTLRVGQQVFTPKHVPSYCHLEWNQLGQSLAVVESNGTLRIFSPPSHAKGHLIMANIHPLRKEPAPNPKSKMPHTIPEQETDPVVLLHWLPVIPRHSKTTLIWTGTQTKGSPDDPTDEPTEWKYDFFRQYPSGPTSPFEGSGSLVCLHRSGRVRLLYQASAHDWMESTMFLTHSELATSRIQTTNILHAAVTPRNPSDKDPQLLLSTYDGALFRVYQVKVRWPSRIIPDPASIQEEDIAKLDSRCIFSGSLLPSYASNLNLTHLCLLPPAPRSAADQLEGKGPDEDANPLLVASFYGVSATRGFISLTASWTVKFEQGDPGTDSPRANLQQHSNYQSRNALLSTTPTRFGTILAMCYADGSVDFLDRNLRKQAPQRRPETVRIFSDVGFAFPKPARKDLALHYALSPSACVIASVSPSGRVRLRRMEYLFGSLSGQRSVESPLPFGNRQAGPDELPSAVAAAVALMHCRACALQQSEEDVFSLLTPSSPSLRREFTRQALHTMMLSLDCHGTDMNDQLRALLRVTALYKIMGAHHTLQLGRDGVRSAEAKATWVTLNLKMALTVLGTTQQSLGTFRPGLAGLIKYTLDLTCHILTEIEEMSRMFEFEFRNVRKPATQLNTQANVPEQRKPADMLNWVQNYVRNKRAPGLIVLLSSMPRGMLISALKIVKNVFVALGRRAQIPRQAHEYPADQTQALKHILDLFSLFPVSLTSNVLLNFLTSIDSNTRNCYEANKQVDRGIAERELLLMGTIPAVMLPAVKSILILDITKLMSSPSVDGFRMNGLDTSWLGLGDDNRTRGDTGEGAVLASIPLTICQTYDISARGAGAHTLGLPLAKMRQNYSEAFKLRENYLKWQLHGGPAPRIPNFPLWDIYPQSQPRIGSKERAPKLLLDGDRTWIACPTASLQEAPNLASLLKENNPKSRGPPLLSPAIDSARTGLTGRGSLKRKLSDPAINSAASVPRSEPAATAAVAAAAGNPGSGAEPSELRERARALQNSVPFLSRVSGSYGPVDGLLKTKIGRPGPMKRCVRCGSVAEDYLWVSSGSACEAVARDAVAVALAASSAAAAAAAAAAAGASPKKAAEPEKSRAGERLPSSSLLQPPSVPPAGQAGGRPGQSGARVTFAVPPRSAPEPEQEETADPDPPEYPTAVFFMPPRILTESLRQELNWTAAASRSCACTGEWAKIV